jgi:hypothetical protein
MEAFKPSQVVLVDIPLVGTLDRTEVEIAAACIVRACQVFGDEWKPISMKQLFDTLEADERERREPFCYLIHNPFARPDFTQLVDRGFARMASIPDDATEAQVELLPVALDRIQKWVRK